ncbi:hypothetical protein H4219_006385 [Mycoemilia scoparia]|uniref:AAA-ATPase-like domain-containing protein n=1 Tax=Mycoemilia scoparia TaxID=417184 RepID=A0A9W7ZHY3_9FUNG|nr:hypothetical protein H4219_006385 [Mycoemilia scoparia]
MADYFFGLVKDKDALEKKRSHFGAIIRYLNEYYNKKYILLIDEFDHPIVNCKEEMKEQVSQIMEYIISPIVKPTKQTMIAKYLIFGINLVNLSVLASGVNNVYKHDFAHYINEPRAEYIEYQDALGFTEYEVALLLEKVVPGEGDKKHKLVEEAKKIAKKTL